MQKVNLISPAFPPQVAQDQFGRFIAPIPGMSKLDYFAITLLPHFLNSTKDWAKDGKRLNAYECAVAAAENMLDELEKAHKNAQKEAETGAEIINLNND